MTLDVLQVIASDDRRGAETFAVALGAELTRRGVELQTVALAPGGSDAPLEVPKLGLRPLGPRTLTALRRAARPARLVFAHGSTTLPACAAGLVGSPARFVYRNIGDPLYWADSWHRHVRTRLFLRRARGVVAVSTDAADALRAELGVPEDRVTVIPTGVAVERFGLPDAEARTAARRRFGVRPEAPVALVLGALSPEKAVDVAIDAVAACDGIELLIVGDGPERPRLEQLARDRLPGRSHFAGAVEDSVAALAAADVLLLPSRTEGLPAAAIEAGLSGVPVVATDVGAVSDVVVDAVTGYLVPTAAPGAMAEGLRRALQGTEQLGRAARRRSLERFGLDQVASEWERVIARYSRPMGAPE